MDGNDKPEDVLKKPEEEWPSVDLAYEYVQWSYDSVLRRLDAVDGRIQTLLVFAATFTTGLPIFSRSVLPQLQISSIWLLLALATFVGIAFIGILSRSFGAVTLLNVKRIYDEWLGYSPWEFKKNAVYWAGQHFESNRSLVNAKGWMANVVTGLLVVEVLLLVAWIMQL